MLVVYGWRTVLVCLLAHTVLGVACLVWGRRLGRGAFLLGALGPVATIVWLASRWGGIVEGRPVVERLEWVAGLDLAFDVRVDGFAALMTLIVAGIGSLVFAYAGRYFGPESADLGRLAGLLTLFAGAMVGLVVADHLLLIYVCWEVTSITSYFMIGHTYRSSDARAAALQALLTTTMGSLAMLGGFVLLGQAAGTFRLSELLADPPSGGAVTAGLLLVALGAVTKSAQVPFHSWLPAAMVAPTPVSTYLHSATMVKAGVVLIARFSPVFAPVNSAWRGTVVGLGIVTMLVGGLRALRQYDLKLLLAYGTISQLGFMVVLFGAGTAGATAAACALILGHAAFKAALFMIVGMLDHETGTRDIRLLPELGAGWGAVKVVGIISAASMAGLPLVFGFIAKEAAFEAFAVRHSDGLELSWLVLAGVEIGSILTVAYTARFVWGAFLAARRDESRVLRAESAPAASFVAPAAVLAVGTAIFGVVPSLLDGIVGAAAQSLDSDGEAVHLAVWHGLNTALALSIGAIVAGGWLFALREPVGRVLRLGDRLPSASEGYGATLRGLNGLADLVTGTVQRGSLPAYLGVILMTASVLPAYALFTRAWPGWPDLVDTHAHLPVVGLLLGAALCAAAVRSRLHAALFLGLVGYSMAGFFVIQGAPDLALTQVAVETLSTVAFVLALRRLPDRFGSESVVGGRALRAGVATAVGVMVFVFAIVAASDRPANPVSDEMVARAVPDGHGRNIVNVILVDFRGSDTMGEITVLAVASIGAVALARAGRRRPDAPPATPTTPGSDGAPGGAAPVDAEAVS